MLLPKHLGSYLANNWVSNEEGGSTLSSASCLLMALFLPCFVSLSCDTKCHHLHPNYSNSNSSGQPVQIKSFLGRSCLLGAHPQATLTGEFEGTVRSQMRRENTHLESYCRYFLLTRVRCGAGNVSVPLVNHKSAPLKCIVCLSVSGPFSAGLLFFLPNFLLFCNDDYFSTPIVQRCFCDSLFASVRKAQPLKTLSSTIVSTFTSFAVILFKCIHIRVHEFSVVV